MVHTKNLCSVELLIFWELGHTDFPNRRSIRVVLTTAVMEIQVFLHASENSEVWVGHMSPDDSWTRHYGRDHLKHALTRRLVGGDLMCKVNNPVLPLTGSWTFSGISHLFRLLLDNFLWSSCTCSTAQGLWNQVCDICPDLLSLYQLTAAQHFINVNFFVHALYLAERESLFWIILQRHFAVMFDMHWLASDQSHK